MLLSISWFDSMMVSASQIADSLCCCSSETHLGVAQLLEAEDFISPDCDELSRMCYVAQFRKYYANNQAGIDQRKLTGLRAADYLKYVCTMPCDNGHDCAYAEKPVQAQCSCFRLR